MEARRIEDLSAEELTKIEEAEKGINTFIEKRAQAAKEQATVEELWAKSVREDRKKRNQQSAQAWYSYHDNIIRSHEATLGFLVSYHKQERARFAHILGLPHFGQEGEDA